MKLGDCEYRDGLLYDPEHGTWGKAEGGFWRVGVTPLLSWLSAGFTSVSLKPVGTWVALGSPLGSVEGPRHFDVIRAPFECVIREVNKKALEYPRVINRDPFDEGWLVLLEGAGDESKLVSLERAAPAIEEKLTSMRVHCFAEFPDETMYEIGTECSAVLVKLNELLEKSPRDTVVHVVSDDPTAEIEMARWQDQTGDALLETRAEGPLHHFIVRKS